MEQEPDSFTLSLDDGIPYWPTLSAIAESPLDGAVLYVGTDDGLLHVSRDAGKTFTEVASGMPGLPNMTWVNGVEASAHEAGRVYVSINNYRNDDYTNYLYRSDDYGASWVSITSDLPADRVVRMLREDLRNPAVLYLGTEFGLFYSLNSGESWIQIGMGLPSVAVNDLVIHPRDNDLILGTHGRGIWILDQLNVLQELSPNLHEVSSHLFTMETARQIRYPRQFPHMGDMVFRGENPPAGAIIDYWVDAAAATPRISIHDVTGEEVAWFEGAVEPGLNREIWNLRHSLPGQGEESAGQQEEFGGGGFGGAPPDGPTGPLVVPGAYTVRLTVDGRVTEQPLKVEEDPRIEVTAAIRARWTADLLEIAALGGRASTGRDDMDTVVEALDEGEGTLSDADAAQARDLHREWGELASRIRRLSGEVEAFVGPLTGDQANEFDYYAEMVETLAGESEGIR
jgi:hypothetical protein